MKIKIVAFLLLLCPFLTVQSQILEPVKWTTSVEKISDTEYVLIATATIDEGWHLYSQNVPEDGPIPTTFTFEPDNGLELMGKVSEGIGETIDDPVFGMRIKFFGDKAEFKQRIKIVNQELSIVKGEVEFMVCDDQRCLPPSYIDLNFDLKNPTPIATNITPTASNRIDFQAPKTNGDNPIVKEIEEEQKQSENRGLFTIFFIAFLSGFAALLTPCVFPMIPMTVSFFTKQSKSKSAGIRNAIIYGLSIIVIYVLLGTAVTAIFGADVLNALATNVWFHIIFFLLLIIFALSFLGAFEIVLPNKWANKVDRQADRGGIMGIFFMALALAIVSFSCTGPIVGTLLVEAASKGGIAPIIGMLGFSLAIALPFALFAAFPGWLNSLPKS
ncbi:MAG TPA: cytochrome c biogenesis protein CcdA, partial [Aquaticitalea sp.]|nr:cytochrome c biogenesis protein CcdA [Aquaticitalea sp.]